jgi:hypothetical protein
MRARLIADIRAFPPKLPESPRLGFVEDKAFQKMHAAIKEPGHAAMVLTAIVSACVYRS